MSELLLRTNANWCVILTLWGLVACDETKTHSRPASAAPTAALTKGHASKRLGKEGASCAPGSLLVPGQGMLDQLLAAEDTDSDRRITIHDQGRGYFDLRLQVGGSVRVHGVYPLATLVQELYLAKQQDRVTIACDDLNEPVVDRMGRLIRDHYWAGLTRRIDAESLAQVLADPKMDERRRPGNEEKNWPTDCTAAPEQGLPQFLYVPHGDEQSQAYYAALRSDHPQLVVCRLPKDITSKWVADLSANEQHGSRHGLLALAMETKNGRPQPLPYVVPGGRFNELYGWDSYFHVLGLLEDHHVVLARAVVDNQLYGLRHYGQVLNANRTYYLTRSQPPFLSSAVRALWQHQGQKLAAPLNRTWLAAAVQLLSREYRDVWSGNQRTTPLCQKVEGSSQAPVCLSTYHAAGIGEPPEVEAGHFDWLYTGRAERLKIEAAAYRESYQMRSLAAQELHWLDLFFMHDRSMRESGHDTTYRWTTDEGDRCADFATVDLNALLFKYELDLASLNQELGVDNWSSWCERAETRKQLMHKYLLNDDVFVDYELKRNEAGTLQPEGKQSTWISATTFYPLWASIDSPCEAADGAPLRLIETEQARALAERALEALEAPGGLTGTAKMREFQGPEWKQRQWDFPFGWAPHQILAWSGLRQFGLHETADRLTYRWLYMLAKNAHDFHGTVPEKYDVVRRSHEVFAEYGNVGTDFSYMTEEGFGWMNASFQIGWASLSPQLKDDLRSWKLTK